MFKLFRRNAPIPPESPRLLERVKALETLVDELDDQLKQMKIQHHKLSGRFYGRFGTGEVSPQRLEAVITSKDDLRRMAGIIPGRPAPHK
jgi:hypothetical protein